MAAGYISSTSGIGVADPYDAGLYEAQQDALNRIQRNRQLDLAEQKQKYDQIKATTSDLSAPTGVMPEHATTTIKTSMDNWTRAKSNYLTLAYRNPTSPQTLKAKEDMDMKKNIYETLVVDSKGVYDVIKSNDAKIAANPDEYNLEEYNSDLANLRTVAQGSPQYYELVRKLKLLPAPVSSVQIAEQFVKNKKASTETGQPKKDAFGNIVADVTSSLYATDEEAIKDAKDLMATDYRYKGQSFGAKVAKDFQEVASDPNRSDFQYYTKRAKQLGVEPMDVYAGDILKKFGFSKQTVQKIGTDPYYKAYQTKMAQLQAEGDNEIEQVGADIIDLAAAIELSPRVISPQITDDEAAYVRSQGFSPRAKVPFLEGRVIGRMASVIDDGKGNLKNVDSDLIVEQAFVDDKGRLFVRTSDGRTRKFDNMTQAMTLLTYNKDPQKEAKNKANAKKLAESQGALENGYNFVSNKLAPVSKEEKAKSQKMFGLQTTKPTDLDNDGKPITAKGAMKQKVEPAKVDYAKFPQSSDGKWYFDGKEWKEIKK